MRYDLSIPWQRKCSWACNHESASDISAPRSYSNPGMSTRNWPDGICKMNCSGDTARQVIYKTQGSAVSWPRTVMSAGAWMTSALSVKVDIKGLLYLSLHLLFSTLGSHNVGNKWMLHMLAETHPALIAAQALQEIILQENWSDQLGILQGPPCVVRATNNVPPHKSTSPLQCSVPVCLPTAAHDRVTSSV